jgi:dUTPase
MFTDWLKTTRELQALSYGVDPHTLTGVERADYITWNLTAMVCEMGEMMAEFPGWKTWVTRRGAVLNRDEFIDEMVDVLHFAGNILSAVGCTDEELTERYMKKVAINRVRMQSGTYDGGSNA